MPKSQLSYSSTLSKYAPRSSEFKAAKYTLIFFVIVNIFTSIWVCIYATQQAEWERRDAVDDPEALKAVKTWTIWTLCVVLIADLISVILLYGVWIDDKRWIAVLGVLAFIFSIYGISSVYTRGSITCFVVPFVVATLSVIMFWLVRVEEQHYEVAATRANVMRTAVKQ